MSGSHSGTRLSHCIHNPVELREDLFFVEMFDLCRPTGTEPGAASTSFTKGLIHNRDTPSLIEFDGIIGTNLASFPTVGAFCLIHLGDNYTHSLAMSYYRSQE